MVGLDVAAACASAAYDNDFQLSTISINGVSAATIQYDVDGLPTRVGSLSMVRHAQNGFITSTRMSGVEDGHTYNTLGDRIGHAASHAGNAVYTASHTRDALGRIATTTETIGGATRVFAYGYDLGGRLIEVRQDGVLTAGTPTTPTATG